MELSHKLEYRKSPRSYQNSEGFSTFNNLLTNDLICACIDPPDCLRNPENEQ